MKGRFFFCKEANKFAEYGNHKCGFSDVSSELNRQVMMMDGVGVLVKGESFDNKANRIVLLTSMATTGVGIESHLLFFLFINKNCIENIQRKHHITFGEFETRS